MRTRQLFFIERHGTHAKYTHSAGDGRKGVFQNSPPDQMLREIPPNGLPLHSDVSFCSGGDSTLPGLSGAAAHASGVLGLPLEGAVEECLSPEGPPMPGVCVTG